MRDEIGDLLKRAKSGEARAFARLLSALESRGPRALTEVAELAAPSRLAFRVGVTGPPGAGKSTLINRLIGELRARGKRVGVVAVDPSSPFSKGAVLGDRIRYHDHFADPDVFIRSLGSRGSYGGLSASAWLMVRAFDAAGFDVVLIETVGVGQTELEIMNVADWVGVVLVPESGDSIQGMKAGLMEIADVFVVNKSDRPGAESFRRELEASLRLDPRAPSEPAEVMATSALDGSGVTDVVERFAKASDAGEWRERRDDPARLKAEATALLRASIEREVEARVSGLSTPSDLVRLFSSAPGFRSATGFAAVLALAASLLASPVASAFGASPGAGAQEVSAAGAASGPASPARGGVHEASVAPRSAASTASVAEPRGDRLAAPIAELARVEPTFLALVGQEASSITLAGTLRSSFSSGRQGGDGGLGDFAASLGFGDVPGPRHACANFGAAGSIDFEGKTWQYRARELALELRESARGSSPYFRLRVLFGETTVGEFLRRLPRGLGPRTAALDAVAVERLASLVPAGERERFESRLNGAIAAAARGRNADLASYPEDVRAGVEALRSLCAYEGRDCWERRKHAALIALVDRTLRSSDATVETARLEVMRCDSGGVCLPSDSSEIAPDARPPMSAPWLADEIERLSREAERVRRSFARRQGLSGAPPDVAQAPGGRWEIVGAGASYPADRAEAYEAFRSELSSIRSRLESARRDHEAQLERARAVLREARRNVEIGLIARSLRLAALANCCREPRCLQGLAAEGRVRIQAQQRTER